MPRGRSSSSGAGGGGEGALGSRRHCSTARQCWLGTTTAATTGAVTGALCGSWEPSCGPESVADRQCRRSAVGVPSPSGGAQSAARNSSAPPAVEPATVRPGPPAAVSQSVAALPLRPTPVLRLERTRDFPDFQSGPETGPTSSPGWGRLFRIPVWTKKDWCTTQSGPERTFPTSTLRQRRTCLQLPVWWTREDWCTTNPTGHQSCLSPGEFLTQSWSQNLQRYVVEFRSLPAGGGGGVEGVATPALLKTTGVDLP